MRRPLARVLVIAALACFVLLCAGAVAHAAEIQGQNTARGAGAGSGSAVGGNVSAFTQGPSAQSVLGASAQQAGSNKGRVAETAKGKTGDTVAAGQVTGATGSTDVMNSNTARFAIGVSGTTLVSNALVDQVGPSALSLLGRVQVSQLGNNSLDASQDVDAGTGDAVTGAQVTGIADAGSAHVSQMNSALGVLSFTGNTAGQNLLVAGVGPLAASLIGNAQASQVGRNDEVLSQSYVGTSGDAVSGAQIAGIEGVGRPFAVQQSQDARLAIAVAGVVATANNNINVVGPQARSILRTSSQQFGDNSSDVSQNVEGTSGEAVAGSQVTGLVAQERARLSVNNQQASAGDLAVSQVATAANALNVAEGPLAAGLIVPQSVFASASQTGDNGLTFGQTGSAATSNAVTGSQITGAVAGDDSTAQVMVSNDAPIALAGGLSGGATAGSQVTGIATGDRSNDTVSAQNNATRIGLNFALAEASAATNNATAGVGPFANAFVDGSASQMGNDTIDATQTTNDGNTATLAAGPAAASGLAGAALPLGRASASQTGNDSVALTQELSSASGDALAGSQVTGVTNGAGGTTKVQVMNRAILSLAASGDIPVPNVASVASGPQAVAGATTLPLANASAQQSGDSTATVSQSVDGSTGDALAGSQVVGATGGRERTLTPMNDASLVFTITGQVTPTNVAVGTLGSVATATTGFAQASTSGKTDLGLDQTFTGESGDGVTGAQIVGAA